MALEIINIGAVANDGTGDPLRVAFEKINNNFATLGSTGYFTTDAYTFNDDANQVIFETDANLFTQATFKINSENPDTDDSQNIVITAAINNDGTEVRFQGSATLFFNDYVTQYNMDIFGGNVRLLVSPLVNTTLYHFISAQVEFAVNAPGVPLTTENGSGLTTENSLLITTES